MNAMNSVFCREQAAVARAQGEAAGLQNVRERSRKSEAAWLAMAALAEEREENRRKLAVVTAPEDQAHPRSIT